MENLGIFEKYLDGSMTELEKSEFLQRLSKDTAFENEFQMYKEVNELVRTNNERSKFLNVLKQTETNYFKSKAKNNSKFILKIAASVAILVVSSMVLYFIYYSKPTNKELFAQYYHTFKVDEITRSNNDSTTKIEDGFIAFQTGNYQQSIKILSSEVIPNEFKTPVNLINGLSYMELGNYKNAENLFLVASEDINNAYYEDCIWYLSLIYIKTDRQTQAIPLLKKLIERKSVYSNFASELIKSIN